jgi:plastocyanin
MNPAAAAGNLRSNQGERARNFRKCKEMNAMRWRSLPRAIARGAAAALALWAGLAAAPPTAADTFEVQLVGIAFSPANLAIVQGDTVTWRNTGGLHNVQARDGSFSSGAPTTGLFTFSHTFNTTGTFVYDCLIHRNMGMTGQVVVVPPQGGGGEPGTLRFGGGTFSVNEGTANATISVVRSAGDDGAVSVDFATSNGSATAGADYTARTGTLTFADNEDGTKTFTVPILDDTQPEGNETVNLALSDPGGGAVLGSPATAVLTIVDNDSGGSAGTLSFAAAAVAAAEDGGPATVSVQRTGGTTGAVSVTYGTADGSASAGSDYTPATGTLSWGNGDGAAKTFTVPLLDDGAIEGDETVNLALSSPTGGAALGSPAAAVLTVTDDDVPAGPCVADDQTLCLQDGRYLVRVDFRAPADPAPRPATAVPFTERAGMFFFFNENNIEMLIKVLNACVEPFNRWWVFYAATTNVEFQVTVVDTERSRVKRYANPQGLAAPPVQDTDAFATCP